MTILSVQNKFESNQTSTVKTAEIGDMLTSGKVNNLKLNIKSDDLQTKLKILESAVHGYENRSITVDTYYSYVQKKGYTLEQFFDLDLNKFRNIVNDIELELSEKFEDECIKADNSEEFEKTIKLAADNGASFDTAVKIAKNNNGKSIIDIINNSNITAKKYKTLSEISNSELKQILKGILLSYKNDANTNNAKTGDKKAVIHALLSSLKSVDQPNYKRIYDAFIEVAPEVDDNFPKLVTMLNTFKNDPDSLEKWIQSTDFQSILSDYGLDENQVKSSIRTAAGIIHNGGLDSVETIVNLMDTFSPEARYNKLKNSDSKNYTQKDFEFIANYEKYQQLKNAKELSDEDKQWLKEFKVNCVKKAENYSNAFGAAIATFDPEKLKDLKELYPDRFDDILTEYAYYLKNDPSIEYDSKYLDEITDGKFSEKYSEIENLNAQSNSNISDLGIPQRVSDSQRLASENNLAVISQTLGLTTRNEDNNSKYTLDAKPFVVQTNDEDKNIFNKSKSELAKGVAMHLYSANELLKKCTANLSSGLGEFALSYIKSLNDIDKKTKLDLIGSFIAKGKIMIECNLDYNKFKGVQLNFDQKKIQEKRANA